MRGLKDKRVLITGGAGGIGSATAMRFLDEGARVVVLDHDGGALNRIESQLPGLHATIRANVADPDNLARAFEDLDNDKTETRHTENHRADS